MPIPLSYSWRNLLTRRLTTALTAGGMALVVFVLCATLMLAEGLRQTLVATGQPDNVVVLRKGSETEVQSGLERQVAQMAATRSEFAPDRRGGMASAKEVVVLMTLPKKRGGAASNVMVRGVGQASLDLRPGVRLIEGRLPAPGSSEIMVGRNVAEKFSGVELGADLRFAQRQWTVVGVFDAGRTAFASEIWGDADQLMQAFRRQAYSVVVARLLDADDFSGLKARLEADPLLQVEVRREREFYEAQSKAMARFLKVLGVSLTAIFSLGAMLGATITMHAAVAGRVGEIGALRALGFQRRDILLAFLAEALLLGAVGGAAGVCASSLLGLLSFSTVNFQTFAELAFTFTLTAPIALSGLGFSIFMGAVGGIFPAVRAARLNIVEALRSG